MIPRLKPYLGKEEFAALFHGDAHPVARFETEFARAVEAKYAISYSYGRSALWAFLKALGIENAEVILPAYTCLVVGHAIVLSNNIPIFVDHGRHDFNMDLDQLEAAITERTRAIISTHLFGYPLDPDRLTAIVRRGEQKYGHKIWIIQDCAHSFGALWGGQLVCNYGDAALFGLGITKLITSIFGGMLTTNDSDLAEKLRKWRDSNFITPGFLKTLRRQLYLMAIFPAFNEKIYGLVYWLQEATPVLDRLTYANQKEEELQFPPDFLDQLLKVEARVGLAQIPKYPQILQGRLETANYYHTRLQNIPELVIPPMDEGATFSHYVVRVANQAYWLESLRKSGIQLGKIIDYVLPDLKAFGPYASGQYPRARQTMKQSINLPTYFQLGEDKRARIVEALRCAARCNPDYEVNSAAGTAVNRH